MEFAWTDDQLALRAQAKEVAARLVATYGRHNDSWMAAYSREAAIEVGAQGWIGMTWPTAVGGGGRPAIDRLIVSEELIAAGAPIGAWWVADRQMGPAIIAYGTDDQRARFLPEIIAGRSTWCIGMSEPGAGSDLAGLTTRAERTGDEFVVNGQKIWTSFAAKADFIYLICRTRSVGPPHAGISEIIVPMDSPGIEVRTIADLTRGEHFCEVFFDDVHVSAANLVGTEGGAFAQTMRQLEHERGGIDRLMSNRALYELALERADTTDPLVRDEIASLECGYRIGRLLVIRETLGQAPTGFSAATKVYCTEHEQRVARFIARVFGADGLLWDQTGQGIVYAPAYTIMGGTSNILRNVLGERVLGLPREPRAS